MNEKQFKAFIKTLKPLNEDINLKEFVKKLKKIYILDFKNVFFVLKGNKYYKDNGYFLNLLLCNFNVPKRIIEKVE